MSTWCWRGKDGYFFLTQVVKHSWNLEHGAKSQLTRRAVERTPRERHTYRTQTALKRLYYRATEDDSTSGPREPQKQRASNGDASSASLVGPLGGADAGARLALESGKRTSGNMGRGFRREGAQDVPGESDAERASKGPRAAGAPCSHRYPVPCSAGASCSGPGTGDMATASC